MGQDSTSQERITKALGIATNAIYDGGHHKMWVVDQMVRALTGCPVTEMSATDANGTPYTYDGQGENDEYWAFVDRADRAGGGVFTWDEGIAP